MFKGPHLADAQPEKLSCSEQEASAFTEFLNKARSEFEAAQELLRQAAEKLGLIERWREGEAPPGAFIREAVDVVRDGRLLTEYIGSRPISPEMASDLEYKRIKQGRLSLAESMALQDYSRVSLYETRKQQITEETLDPRVLYIASGGDGIPGCVFGKENVILLSQMERPYFDAYCQWHSQIQPEPKIWADMYHIPLIDQSCATIIMNGIDVFNEREMAGFGAENEEVKTPRDLLLEMRRVIDETHGRVLITNFALSERDAESAQLVSEENMQLLADCGWNVSRVFRYHGNSCCELLPDSVAV